jgi:hypothetical protein
MSTYCDIPPTSYERVHDRHWVKKRNEVMVVMGRIEFGSYHEDEDEQTYRWKTVECRGKLMLTLIEEAMALNMDPTSEDGLDLSKEIDAHMRKVNKQLCARVIFLD